MRDLYMDLPELGSNEFYNESFLNKTMDKLIPENDEKL
jgi:hypothetical protein